MSWVIPYAANKDLVEYQHHVEPAYSWWQVLSNAWATLLLLVNSCNQGLMSYWPYASVVIQVLTVLIVLRIAIYILHTVEELAGILLRMLNGVSLLGQGIASLILYVYRNVKKGPTGQTNSKSGKSISGEKCL